MAKAKGNKPPKSWLGPHKLMVMPHYKVLALRRKARGGNASFDYRWDDMKPPQLMVYQWTAVYARKVRENTVAIMKKKGITTRRFSEIAHSLSIATRWEHVYYLGKDPGFKDLTLAKLYGISLVLDIDNPFDLIFRDFTREGIDVKKDRNSGTIEL